MKTRIDKPTIAALVDAGLIAPLRIRAGFEASLTLDLTVPEIADYLRRGDAMVADRLGVPLFQLTGWKDAQGIALCAGTLADGRPCSGIAGSGLSLSMWIATHRRGLCRRHSDPV